MASSLFQNTNLLNTKLLNTNFTTLNTVPPLVVDLNPAPAKAKVVREGYEVPTPVLDVQKSNFFIDNLQQIPIRAEPRVVSQTVPAGTKVLPGTTIDLVLAPTSVIPFDIFGNVHNALKGKTVNALTDTILQDATVRQTLLKYDTAADVTAADKTLLTNSFAQVMPVDEANAGTSFAAAFDSARGALAFR